MKLSNRVQLAKHLASLSPAPTGILPGPGLAKYVWATRGIGRPLVSATSHSATAYLAPQSGNVSAAGAIDAELAALMVGLQAKPMTIGRPGWAVDGYAEDGELVAGRDGWTELRHCLPYAFKFQARAKRRWVGQRVLDLLASEFSWRPREYWDGAAASGFLLLDDGPVAADTTMGENALITHRSWRFEPPVLARSPRLLAVTQQLVVVEKPPSLPMHPGGGYNFLTLRRTLEACAPWLGSLRVAHRLDRVTGGVVLLARSAQAAQWVSQVMQRRCVSKTYLARVRGRFPAGPINAHSTSTSTDTGPDPDTPAAIAATAATASGASSSPTGSAAAAGAAAGAVGGSWRTEAFSHELCALSTADLGSKAEADVVFPELPWPPEIASAPWQAAANCRATARLRRTAEDLGLPQEAMLRWLDLPADDAWAPGDAGATDDVSAGAGAHVQVRPPLPSAVDAAGAWLLVSAPLALERRTLANGDGTGVAAPAPPASSPPLSASATGTESDSPSEGGSESVAVVSAAGKPSHTLVRRVAPPFFEAGEWWSLVAARPLTGRTHQIRAHVAAAGFPIGNDAVYGDPSPLPGAPPARDVAPRRGVPDPEAAAAAAGPARALAPPWADPRVNAEFCVRSYTTPRPVIEHSPAASLELRKALTAQHEAAKEELAEHAAVVRAEVALRRQASGAAAWEGQGNDDGAENDDDGDDVDDDDLDERAGRTAEPEDDTAPPGKRTKAAGPLIRVPEDVLRAAASALPLALAGDSGAADPRCDDGSPLAEGTRAESWYLRYGPREDFSAGQLGTLGIWLHSVRYRGRSSGGGTWEFGCGMPSWAERAMRVASEQQVALPEQGTATMKVAGTQAETE